MMRNKLRLAIGWFGVLTPVYAAGALTALFFTSGIEAMFFAQVSVVSAINFYIGRRLLRMVVPEKEVKKHGHSTARN